MTMGLLTGEIKVGDKFIWEPHDPKAYERITVTKIEINSDGEAWIESKNDKGQRNWNEEGRFREACVRVVESSLPPNLRATACCASCTHHQGWFDNMHCGKHDYEVSAYMICDDYKSE